MYPIARYNVKSNSVGKSRGHFLVEEGDKTCQISRLFLYRPRDESRCFFREMVGSRFSGIAVRKSEIAASGPLVLAFEGPQRRPERQTDRAWGF
jgi:hypothetical protein